MRVLRLTALVLTTFLLVISGAFWRKVIAVLLCGALGFNSSICNSYFLCANNTYIAEAAQIASSKDAAKKIVADFKVSTKKSPWKTDWKGSDTYNKLNHAVVAKRLEKLIDNPELLNQGFLGLCGPAGFFSLWFKYDPVSATKFVTELYDNGDSKIGDYRVSAHRSFLLNFNDYSSLVKRRKEDFEAKPPIIPTKPEEWFADWMMLSALRNQENAFRPYTGDLDSWWNQEKGSGTYLEEIKKWLQSAKLYDSVDITYEDITKKDKLGEDVVIIAVNPNLLYPDKFPPDSGHVIVPESPVIASQNNVSFVFWTWGQRFSGKFTEGSFKKYYRGAIVVKKKDQDPFETRNSDIKKPSDKSLRIYAESYIRNWATILQNRGAKVSPIRSLIIEATTYPEFPYSGSVTTEAYPNLLFLFYYGQNGWITNSERINIQGR